MATSSLFFPSSLSAHRRSPNLRPPLPKTLTLISSPSRLGGPPLALSPTSTDLNTSKSHLLTLISDQQRGLRTQSDPSKRSSIIAAIDALAAHGEGSNTTDASLSGTWRMLWTTEKEQLFIIKNAGFFGTEAGDVLQVIDVGKRVLNNVITFPPTGVFFVRSEIEVAPPQRVNFRFTSAVLRVGGTDIPLPPFGQGWFESVYLDQEIRVAKDIRGDYLVVDRAPCSWKE